MILARIRSAHAKPDENGSITPRPSSSTSTSGPSSCLPPLSHAQRESANAGSGLDLWHAASHGLFIPGREDSESCLGEVFSRKEGIAIVQSHFCRICCTILLRFRPAHAYGFVEGCRRLLPDACCAPPMTGQHWSIIYMQVCFHFLTCGWIFDVWVTLPRGP